MPLTQYGRTTNMYLQYDRQTSNMTKYVLYGIINWIQEHIIMHVTHGIHVGTDLLTVLKPFWQA